MRKLVSVGFCTAATVVGVAPAALTDRGFVVVGAEPGRAAAVVVVAFGNAAFLVCTVDAVSPFGTDVVEAEAISFAPAAEGTVVVGAT